MDENSNGCSNPQLDYHLIGTIYGITFPFVRLVSIIYDNTQTNPVTAMIKYAYQDSCQAITVNDPLRDGLGSGHPSHTQFLRFGSVTK